MKGSRLGTMLSTSDRITTPQATIIVINYILGTGILTLPRTSAENVKTPDILLHVIWIMQIFTSFNMGHYAAALGLSQLFQKNIYSFMHGLLPIVHIITMLPKHINDLLQLGGMVGNVAFFLFGLLPLLLISKWKGRSHETQS